MTEALALLSCFWREQGKTEHMTSVHLCLASRGRWVPSFIASFSVSESHHHFQQQVQAHFIPSGTRLAEENLDKFFVHDASNTPNREAGQGSRTLASHS